MAAGKRDFSKSSVSMKDELTCPVCQELFDEPVILPCSHSLCWKCLGKINDQDGGISCPWKCFQIKSCGFVRNLALEQVTFRYKKRKMEHNEEINKDKDSGGNEDIDDNVERAASGDVDCDFCSDTAARRAKYSCKQCRVSYCRPCLEQYHPWEGKLAEHTLRILYGEISAEYQMSCRDHEEKKATIFCKTCSVLVCHLCIRKEVGKHVSHEIIDTETAAQQQKKSVANVKDEAVTYRNSLSRHKSVLANRRTQIETTFKEAANKVNEQIRNLMDDLNSTSEEIVNTETSYLNKEKSALITEINRLEEENEQVAHKLALFMEMSEIFMTSHESSVDAVEQFGAMTETINNWTKPMEVYLAKMNDMKEPNVNWGFDDFIVKLRGDLIRKLQQGDRKDETGA